MLDKYSAIEYNVSVITIIRRLLLLQTFYSMVFTDNTKHCLLDTATFKV